MCIIPVLITYSSRVSDIRYIILLFLSFAAYYKQIIEAKKYRIEAKVLNLMKSFYHEKYNLGRKMWS